MSTPNIESEVKKALKEVTRVYFRELPVKVGKEVVSSVRQNFRCGGFYGSPWQRTKRQEVPFKGAAGTYGPLLSKSTHLMSSTDYIPGQGQVTIRNNTPYARYHNEGASTKVTAKMKKYFWAKFFESTGIKKDDNKEVKKRKRNKPNPEADFWRAMALKKPGRMIKLPKRQFLGPSPAVDRIVSDVTKRTLENLIEKL